MLRRLRFPVDQSLGRRYPQAPHPYRNDFERDRDRIVHSRAFRRLQEKTQVFTEPLSDHLRNRLTHTIEVAQIARTAARTLELDQDLTEALALAHDLGHPPFGHAGEAALNEQMQAYGDSFNHNLHSLRIVEIFEQRYPGFPGLNLTFEVREGLLKHSRDFDVDELPELAEYLLERRPTLEAQLIDPADEIAYNCADLDDAVESHVLDVKTVSREIAPFERLHREAREAYPNEHRFAVFNQALGGLIDFFVSGLIAGTAVAAEEAGLEGPEDVFSAPERVATMAPSAAEAARQLKTLLGRQVYDSPNLKRDSEHGAEKVRRLFRHFMERPEALPRPYREQAENAPLHRAVCDYIAGMTDTFLARRYDELLRDPRQ